jgi:rhodanese-related sulfurtransferase
MEAPRISKEDALEKLGKSDAIVIDVRAEQDWQSSDSKISKAVRQDKDHVESWAHEYDFNSTLILYCG